MLGEEQEGPQASSVGDDGDAVDMNDILQQVNDLISEEKLFAAERLLMQVPESMWTDKHKQVVETSREIQNAIADLFHHGRPPHADHLDDASDQGGWKRQGENHGGHHDTTIYYKVDHATSRLTCRIETPMELSLLVPLLAVLNEVELYTDWIPSWRVPIRIGVDTATMLHQEGRANQTLQVTGNVPWPYHKRQVILQAIAVDAIEGRTHNQSDNGQDNDDDDESFIAVRIKNPETGGVVPPPEPGVERVDFDGAFVFQACPKERITTIKIGDEEEPTLLLASFKMHMNPHMAGIPISVFNFITRTVLGAAWAKLLRIAEGVRDGKLPNHKKNIQEKAEFYAWVERRVNIMVHKIKSKHSSSSIGNENRSATEQQNAVEVVGGTMLAGA